MEVGILDHLGYLQLKINEGNSVMGGTHNGDRGASSKRWNRSCLRIGCLLSVILACIGASFVGAVYWSPAFRQCTYRGLLIFQGREGARQRQAIEVIERAASVQVSYCESDWIGLGWTCESTTLDDEQLARLASEFRALRVKNLVLHHSPIADVGARSLQSVDTLRLIDLRWTRIGDVGVAHIAKMPNLEILMLDGTRVTDAGLKSLQDLRHLRYLSLRDTSVTDRGLLNLEHIQTLKSLHVGNSRVTDEGIKRIEAALPALHIDAIARPKGK